MRKIPTLFIRDPDDRKHVLNQVDPRCEWVLSGGGVATQKWDGVGVMLDDDGEWWSRRSVKLGQTRPPDFVELDHDDVTGETVGWVPVEQSPHVKYHRQAVDKAVAEWMDLSPGTYELVGPKINGNTERREHHELLRHGDIEFPDMPRDFDGLRTALLEHGLYGMEGVVWHNPDGIRFAKLKARDFKARPTT
jgi:hypothetical protein